MSIARALCENLLHVCVKLCALSNLSMHKIAVVININNYKHRELLKFKYKVDPPSSHNTIRERVIGYASKLKKKVSLQFHKFATLIFDRWTSISNARILNLIALYKNRETNLCIIEVPNSASAEYLL